MALQSRAFGGDSKLEAAAVSDPAHITPGATGDCVKKIQQALILLDGVKITADGIFGPATGKAVLAYKTKRNIVNRAYQTQPDSVVGKMTMTRLDQDMTEWESAHQDETEDQVNAEINVLMMRMSVYPGGPREAAEIYQLRASATPAKSPEVVGFAPVAVAGGIALLLIVAIFAIVALMILARRSGKTSELNRLKRELDEKIARFNHTVAVLVAQGATTAILDIIKLIGRAQAGYDQDVDECRKNAKDANGKPDPNRWKDCIDKRLVRGICG